MSMGTSRVEGHVAMLGLGMAFLVPNRLVDRTIVERRRGPRRRPLYLRFFAPVPGLIVDLSRQGMAVRTTVELPVGREVRFRVRHRSQVLTLAGVVRWLGVGESGAMPASQAPAVVFLGIEFVEELAVDGLDFMTGNGSPISG